MKTDRYYNNMTGFFPLNFLHHRHHRFTDIQPVSSFEFRFVIFVLVAVVWVGWLALALISSCAAKRRWCVYLYFGCYDCAIQLHKIVEIKISWTTEQVLCVKGVHFLISHFHLHSNFIHGGHQAAANTATSSTTATVDWENYICARALHTFIWFAALWNWAKANK